MSRGKRFESARRLFILLRFAGKTQVRQNSFQPTLQQPYCNPSLAKNYITATTIHRLHFKKMNLRMSVLVDLDFRLTEFYEGRRDDETPTRPGLCPSLRWANPVVA
jgi:hypothetical protein